MTRFLLALSLFLLLCLLGCGPSGTSGNTVSGKVTYHNQPVSFGVVQFYVDGRAVGQGRLTKDGSYEAKNLPAGEVSIVIATVLPPMGGPPGLGGSGPPGMGGGPPGMPPGGAPDFPGTLPPDPHGVPVTPPGQPGAANPADNKNATTGKQPAEGAPPGGEVATEEKAIPPGQLALPPDVSEEMRPLLMEVQIKYGNPRSPRLTYTVRSGNQTHDLPLE